MPCIATVGDGTFEDATEPLLGWRGRDWPTSAAFGDFDGEDGDLDRYGCRYCHFPVGQREAQSLPDSRRNRYTYCAPQYSPSLPDHLFRNDGIAGLPSTDRRDRDRRRGWAGAGVVAADMDGDGRVDIYVANDQSANFLFRNKGGQWFEEIAGARAWPARNGTYQASKGVAHGDADGDGRPRPGEDQLLRRVDDLLQEPQGGEFHGRDGGDRGRGPSCPARLRRGKFLGCREQRRLARPGHGQWARERPPTPEVLEADAPQLLPGPAAGDSPKPSPAGPLRGKPAAARPKAVGDLDNDAGGSRSIDPAERPAVAYFHNRGEAGHGLDAGVGGDGPRISDAIAG